MGGRELPREKDQESNVLLHQRVPVPITLEKVCDRHVDRVESGMEVLYVVQQVSLTTCKSRMILEWHRA